MVAEFVSALARLISRVRLENYRSVNSSDDLDMAVNYFFNLELSESLYPSLQAFEISLRNSIHSALSNHYGSPYWFDVPRLFPNPRPPATESWQLKAVREARAKLTLENKPLDSNRIVAELNFGFWHGMLNRPFEARVWRHDRWRVLREVFPYAPRRLFDRQIAWDRCDRTRIIRNRVMHYEPTWARPHLARDHQEILETLRWISIDMYEAIAMFDRFPSVHGVGRGDIERRIATEVRRRSGV